MYASCNSDIVFVGTTFTASAAQFIARNLRGMVVYDIFIGNTSHIDAVMLFDKILKIRRL